jgi:hypothetical protein
VALARATGGSTTRNTGEMRPMETDKRRINLAVRVLLIVLAAELAIVQAAAELVLQAAELGTARVVGQELAIALVVERELAIALVVERELAIAQVVAELEPDPVVGQELAIALVPAGPEPGPQRGRLAVALRTKSVTAAHHHDLVPLLAAAALAAAVETTRVPAATGEVVAWAVADIAVVVAEDAAAEE